MLNFLESFLIGFIIASIYWNILLEKKIEGIENKAGDYHNMIITVLSFYHKIEEAQRKNEKVINLILDRLGLEYLRTTETFVIDGIKKSDKEELKPKKK